MKNKINKVILINELDNVYVALTDLKKGDKINDLILLNDIPQGHKIALTDIKKNKNIIKYGYPIGHATINIKAGSWVHTHNIATNLSGKIQYSYNPKFNEIKNKVDKIEVKVFKRYNGEIGIRNNILIVPMVGCINEIAEKIRVETLKKHKEIKENNIIVTKHPYGCSQLGEDNLNTIKTLQAIIKHPNNGGVLVLGLGCENNQMEPFIKTLGKYDKNRIKFLIAQKVEDEIKEGVKILDSLIKITKKDKRVKMPLSCINIGLKCGGSDGFSGISANPLVGKLSDYIVNEGGSTILSEVPEMFGAETILMDRADSKNTFKKIVNLINNFKKYYADHHQVCYENPSPGNKMGGITTLEDKSLGCTQKAGTSKVKDVLYLGDKIKIKGLNLLNGPGNDMVACTNLSCSHVHLICFTTGRGTPFGTYIPTIKISTNTKMYIKKKNWIDFNAGQIIDGVEMNIVFKDFLNKIINIINGEESKNEINNFQDIAIFKDGVTL